MSEQTNPTPEASQDKERFITAWTRKMKSASKKALGLVKTAAKVVVTVVTAPVAWLAKAVAFLLAKAVKVVAWAAFTLAGSVAIVLFGAATLLGLVLIAAFKVVYLFLLLLQLPYLAIHPDSREAIKTDWRLYAASWKPANFAKALTITEMARREAAVRTAAQAAQAAAETPAEVYVEDDVIVEVSEETVIPTPPAGQAPKGRPTPKQRKTRPAKPHLRPAPSAA